MSKEMDFSMCINTLRPIRVICIGAGISGIAAAYKSMLQLQNVEFLIYEKNSDIGGTWFENKYPGCACDIPAHLYTYSWEPNPDWSRFYVEAAEIHAYFKNCATKWNVSKLIKLSHKVIGAKWDERGSCWCLEIEGPDGIVFGDRCEVLINATGILNKWKWPDIAGLHEFSGSLMHSACWDNTVDLKGKKVAVIGAGSSAIQIVPSIQPVVAHLTTFIRSPTWITPEYGQQFANDGRTTVYSASERHRFSTEPSYFLRYRAKLLNASTSGYQLYYKGSELQAKAVENCQRLMRERLKDRGDLCEKLIPNFEVGCTRLTPGNGYLEALTETNVTPIFDHISHINATGIVTKDGSQHSVDVIVCATGFDVSHRPNFPVIGIDGIDLRDAWKEELTHYLSVAVPGYPNYFMIGGPNSPISNVSLIYGLEVAAEYALTCVKKIQKEMIASVEVTQTATRDFLHQRDKMMQNMVWSGSCSSWYKGGTRNGPITGPWCGSFWHYADALKSPRWEDYSIKNGSENRFDYFGNGRIWEERIGENIAQRFYDSIASSNII